MFNPTKYPYGKGGLKTPRDAKLTMQRYFNQRLLDVDGRFGKDIEYLLTEQYTVEDTSTQLREHRHAPDTGKMPQRSRCSHGGFCKEQERAPADYTKRRRVQIPETSQRITGVLPSSAVRSPCHDQRAGGCQRGSSPSQQPTCSGPTSYSPSHNNTEPFSRMKTSKTCLSMKRASGYRTL